MSRKMLCVLSVLSILLMHSAGAQTSLNPDLSALGDFRVYSHNDNSRPSEAEKLSLADPALELFIGGYLNPYARADVVVAWHDGHDAAIEELYATFLRGLPLNMNVRAGKYRLEFGRLNPTHPHAYSFVFTPLPHREFFGEEGLSDVALQSSILVPTGSAFTEAKVALLKGSALSGHGHQHAEEEEAEDERSDLGVFARLTTSFATSETGELALGASILNSPYAEEHHDDTSVVSIEEPKQLRATVIGVDLKYKNKPSRYRSLQIEAEALMRTDEQPEELTNTKSYGAYGYLDYRFLQRYNLGGIGEWVRNKELVEPDDPAEEHAILQHDIWRAGLFVGFAPVEETSLIRLAGHWTKPEHEDGFWEVTLQLVFSLGPHQPHNF